MPHSFSPGPSPGSPSYPHNHGRPTLVAAHCQPHSCLLHFPSVWWHRHPGYLEQEGLQAGALGPYSPSEFGRPDSSLPYAHNSSEKKKTEEDMSGRKGSLRSSSLNALRSVLSRTKAAIHAPAEGASEAATHSPLTSTSHSSCVPPAPCPHNVCPSALVPRRPPWGEPLQSGSLLATCTPLCPFVLISDAKQWVCGFPRWGPSPKGQDMSLLALEARPSLRLIPQ